MIRFVDTARPAPKPIASSLCPRDLPYPADPEMVRFIIRTRPDARGRQSFFALRSTEGGKPLFASYTGECLKAHRAQAKREGMRVEVIDRSGADLRVRA